MFLKARSSNCHYRLYLVLTFCYIGVILYLSSLSSASLSFGGSTAERILSNIAHIPLYGVLAILLFLFFKYKIDKGLNKINRNVVLVAMCIAILDELNQSTTPGRHASLLDILLDAIGIFIALWVANTRLFSITGRFN